jgi:hypothetical protein
LILTVINTENANKGFFETSRELLGLGSCEIQTNDVICVFGACNLPVVLRLTGSHHLFIGLSYVSGLTSREMLHFDSLRLDAIRDFETY